MAKRGRKPKYKTKEIKKGSRITRLMQCKRGCRRYTVVGETTKAVTCTHCHTRELYSEFDTYDDYWESLI